MIGVRAAIIAIGTSRHNHRFELYQAREAAHSATAPLPGRLEPRRFVLAIRDMGVTWIEMAMGSAANNTRPFFAVRGLIFDPQVRTVSYPN